MGGGERPDPSRVLERLKPFQRDTAEHVFRCLYEQPGGSRRFLVADEVGLGKTLVARGVIAKAIHHLWPKLPEIGRIDVVYICSNGQIARQNLNRLNVIGGEAAVHATRVTMLPVQLHGLREREVNFISFTPGSSFDLTGGMGQWQERIVLYWMLRECWGFGDVAGPKNFFQGGVTHENTEWFREQVAAFPDKAPDRSRVCWSSSRRPWRIGCRWRVTRGRRRSETGLRACATDSGARRSTSRNRISKTEWR